MGAWTHDYDEVREACEGAVERWEWGTSHLHDLRPLHAERWQLKKGRAYKAEPKRKTAGICHFGLDWWGRPRVVRRYSVLPDAVDEEFFIRTREGFDAIRFLAHDKLTAHVSSYRFERGLLLEHRFADDAAHEAFEWLDGRLARAVMTQRGGRVTTHHHEYDATGRLRAIRREEELVYQTPPIVLSKSLRRAEQLLLELIPLAVTRVHLDEDVYCVGLTHREGFDSLPPRVSLGLERHREAWLEAERNDAAALWRSQVVREELELVDQELHEVCADISRAQRDAVDPAPALTLLTKVIRRLNRLDWSDIAGVTDDFVVVPLNHDGGVDRGLLSRAVPSTKRSWLERAGFL